MPNKTVPLSVRVSLEDSEFIARMDIPGATTPSEKLRTIISDTRQRSDGLDDYEGCLKNFNELTSSALKQLKNMEHDQNLHSELVLKVLQWAEETLAYIAAEVPTIKPKGDNSALLENLEAGVADKTFGFIEAVMRMGISENSNCYSSNVVSSRMKPVIGIAKVIDSIQE